MDWQDDEFEAFLHQFRPRKPKALDHRRTWIALGIAAAVILAIVVPIRVVSRGSTRPSASTSTLTNSAKGGGTDATSDKSTTGHGPTSLSSGGGQAGPPRPNPTPSTATDGATTRRVRVGEGVRPPTKLVDVKPEYPEDARSAGIHGVVILDIVIGEDGSVIEARVIRSIPELDQAAIDAVRQWRFEPTLLNGEPVEVEMNVTVNFTSR